MTPINDKAVSDSCFEYFNKVIVKVNHQAKVSTRCLVHARIIIIMHYALLELMYLYLSCPLHVPLFQVHIQVCVVT